MRSNGNIACQWAFHVVWCPKYRRRVLGGRIEARLEELIREVIDEKGAWLVEMEVMPDHVHLLVEVDPQFGIHRLVKAIKGRSSGVLRQEFPDQLLLRGHRRRGALGGRQALRREPEEPVRDRADRT